MGAKKNSVEPPRRAEAPSLDLDELERKKDTRFGNVVLTSQEFVRLIAIARVAQPIYNVLVAILANKRTKYCQILDHEPLRSPLCANCQLDARIEEAEVVLEATVLRIAPTPAGEGKEGARVDDDLQGFTESAEGFQLKKLPSESDGKEGAR